jgi:hypothetical protein
MHRHAFLFAIIALPATVPSALQAQPLLWTDDDADAVAAGYQHTYAAAAGGGSYVTTITGGTSVPVSTAPRYLSTNAIEYDYKLSRGQGVSIELDVFHATQGTTVDITQYTYLCFHVLGTTLGQYMRVGCQSGDDNTTAISDRVPLAPYLDDGGSGEGVSDTVWRGANVPTYLLMAGGSAYDASAVDRVTFMLLRDEIRSNEQGTLWIDNIHFAHTPLPVRITSLAAQWCGNGIQLTWNDLRRAWHVGFRVYREVHPDGQRTRLGQASVTEQNGHYTALDREADPRNCYLYTISAVMPDGAEEACDSVRVAPRKP